MHNLERMNLAETNRRSIQTIVAYTADPWQNVLPVLRYLAPAQLAGLQVLQGNQGDRIDVQKVDMADLVLIQRDFPRFTRACAEIVISARKQGKPIIYETDDLLVDLPDTHISYADLSLYITPMLCMVNEADLVTTSTPFLYEYIKPLQPKIQLLPNTLHDRLWVLNPIPVPTDSEKTVIGYMGGGTHFHDLCSIAPVLLRLLEGFPDAVVMHFWGCKPPPDLVNHSRVRWTPLSILDYAEFAAFFNRQRIDIAIAPLEDSALNRAKSHLKFLEYSAIGAAGVYSRLPPYENIVSAGENGYLASSIEEWEAHLTRLIQNPIQRVEIARQAQATVRQNWLLSEHAGLWREAYTNATTGQNHNLEKLERTLFLVTRTQDRILGLEAERSLLAYQQQVSQQQINALNASLACANQEITENKIHFQKELVKTHTELIGLQAQLDQLQQSRGAKFLKAIYRLRHTLIPADSRREKILQRLGFLTRK